MKSNQTTTKVQDALNLDGLPELRQEVMRKILSNGVNLNAVQALADGWKELLRYEAEKILPDLNQPLEAIVPFINSLKESEQSILRELYNRGARRTSIDAVLGRFLEERVNPEAFAIDVPAPTGSITFNLEISVNNRYTGNSPANIIYTALVAYRRDCMNSMLANIGGGDYHEAYINQSDLEDINQTIDTFVEGLNLLANKNFWAIDDETADGGILVKAESDKRFERFMNSMGLTPSAN